MDAEQQEGVGLDPQQGRGRAAARDPPGQGPEEQGRSETHGKVQAGHQHGMVGGGCHVRSLEPDLGGRQQDIGRRRTDHRPRGDLLGCIEPPGQHADHEEQQDRRTEQQRKAPP